jgi:hypothetical protein
VTAGEADPKTGRMTIGEPQSDRRSLVVERAVDGIPVWSSRLKLDLDEKAGIAALELSWPKIVYLGEDGKPVPVPRQLIARRDTPQPERKEK